MSNHRQWVELDPTNGATSDKPQDAPAGPVEDPAVEGIGTDQPGGDPAIADEVVAPDQNAGISR
ncbi:hypothetical protein [Azospirillum sp. sgz302134]